MEDINEEIENKQVERLKIEITDGDSLCQEASDIAHNNIAPHKTKKIRSEKQIAAFEKAKIKRAENIASKKLEKETLKKEKKEKKKTTIKEEPSIIDSLPNDEKEQLRVKATMDTAPRYKPVEYQHSQGHYNHQPQPIINNYYYGSTDNNPRQSVPVHKEKHNTLRRKAPVEPEWSTSEEEEETYTEEEIIEDNLVPTNPTLKYKFV